MSARMSFDWQVEQNDEVKARKKYFTISLPENSELFIQGWRSFSHEALCKHFCFPLTQEASQEEVTVR